MRSLLISLLALGFALPALSAPPPSEPRDLRYFLRNLHNLDHLPALENAHTAMDSTWDRAGGNRDGHDFKRIEGDRNVLMDVAGPGCLHRVFTGVVGAALQGTIIRFYFDGEATPRLAMDANTFFDPVSGPFPWPLAFNGNGPSRGITYPGVLFPIPFQQRLRVELYHPEAERLTGAGKPDVPWGNYWQLTYTRYAADTPVRSFSWPLSEEERREVGKLRSAWLAAVAGPPALPRGSLSRSFRLPPGGSAELALRGAGVIRQFRLALAPNRPQDLMALRLQLFWDGETNPSLDLPAGRLFGHGDYGHDLATLYASLLVGVEAEEAWCAFPMPYAKGARIRMQNTGGENLEVGVRLHVENRRRLPSEWGRFSATLRSQRIGLPGNPVFGPRNVPGHVLLEASGRGKYVGNFLFVDWPSQIWWGEGDWLIWSDEETWPPSYHGTGSEEYYNSGWCVFDRKAISGFVKMRPGPVTVYSFHLNDAFNFRESLRVVVEMMPWGNAAALIEERHPLWESAAFWYRAPGRE